METKMEIAIRDTKLRLDKVKMDLMLLSRERDVLQKQFDSLELINQKVEEPINE